MNKQQVSEYIAKELLRIEAVKLSPEKPFKWSSGWNSPIYCDNRKTLSYPELRTFIKNAFAEIVNAQFATANVIAGVATAGIPQGALLADVLSLPYIYVRSSPKGHGLENLIEGKLDKGQKVVVVEDLISTGGSSLKVVDALRQAGAEVIGMLAIFTYGFPLANQNFENFKVPYVCLSSYEELLPIALANGYIKESELELLSQWKNSPETWEN
jgi:orotate phosphoribosyltransferase